MLNKIKKVYTEMKDTNEASEKRVIDLSIFTPDEANNYRKLMNQFKENIE